MTRPHHPKRGASLFLSLILLASCFLLQNVALANVPPAFERLAPISAQVEAPTGLALDRQGRIYVAETTGNRVAVFSQGGRFLHAITGAGDEGPVSVAVAVNGQVYIGNKNTGSVSVYDSGFTFLYKLGQGDGEFGFPGAIAVDNAANKIYVTDRINSAVRTYNPDGSFSASLGQPGNANGQFHRPISIAVDPAAGELVVLDQQQRKDMLYGTMIDGARIQYFDLNGAFLRAYSKFGYKIDAGQLSKPFHVTVDESSRLYVTDSRRQKVLVYDKNNTYLGQLEDPAHSLQTPLGLVTGATNRLYISSHIAGQIEVYGLDQYTAMDVSPPALSFQAVAGGANPAPQSTTIANNGNTAFNWTAASQSTRLTLADTSGAILVSGSRALEVGMNSEGLAPGIYTDSIDITNDSGATETINVSLTVLPNPLQVTPMALAIDAEIGTTPAGQALSVSTGGSNPVEWTASADQGWLSISNASGTTPEDIRVYAAAKNMAAGTYTGLITFSSQGDDPAPVTVAVTLNLTDPGDTTSPPVEPPPPGQNDGNKKWTVTQVVPGTALNGVWGSSAKDIFAVGSEGTILHNDGRKWIAMDSGSSSALYSVWGISSSNVYAVGESGLVLHYNGTDWAPAAAATEEDLHDVGGTKSDVLAVDTFGAILSDTLASSTETGVALRSIWGSSASDIFAAGEAGVVLHYDGHSWTSMDSDTTQWLNSVWGSSAGNVFAVGENGAIIHYDGTMWSAMDSGTTETLHSVWGGSGTDVFAVGADGLMLHYNGMEWTPVSSGAAVTLNDVWVSPRSEVYAVGDDGFIVSGKSKFPWMHFVASTIVLHAATKNDDDDVKTEKGPVLTQGQEGKQ